MGNLGDRYLWRPTPSGPIYVRFKFKLLGNAKARTFVKSLGTRSYPEARRIRDRSFMPILTSLRCARGAQDLFRFVAKSAGDVIERDLSLAVEALGIAQFSQRALPAPGLLALAPPPSQPKGNGMTWGELSAAYREHIRKRKAVSTVAKYERQLDEVDAFLDGDTPLDDIDRKRVAAFLSYMEEQGKHRDTTINQYVAQIGKVFIFGRSQKGLDMDNPASGVCIRGAQHVKQRAFTPEEADAAAALEPPRTKAYPSHVFTMFSVIARHTGARIGEIAGLQAADVTIVHDIRCLRFRTEKTRSRGGRSHVENEMRLVPIAPKLKETVDECLDRNSSGRLFPRNGQWKWKSASRRRRRLSKHSGSSQPSNGLAWSKPPGFRSRSSR